MNKRVVVINWSGLNYGDNELFNLLYKKYLKDNFEKVYLFADYKQDIYNDDSVEFVSKTQGIQKKWIKAAVCMMKSKDVICGGGDIIRGEIGTTLLLLLAIVFKRNVGIFGVGVLEICNTDKLKYKIKEKIQGYILKRCKVICVRDEKSYKIAKRYTDRVRNSIDMCFIYKLLDNNTIKEKENIVAVSLIPPSKSYNNEWDEGVYMELAKYFDYLIEKHNIIPKFLIGTKEEILKKNNCSIIGDDIIANTVIKYMKYSKRAKLIEHIPSYKEASEVIMRSKFTFSFRLHYTITSMINQTPVIAVNYASKIEQLLSKSNMYKYMLDIKDLKLEKMIEVTDRILNEEDINEKNIDRETDRKIKELIFEMEDFLKIQGAVDK